MTNLAPNVFISWSGQQSGAVAEALREWLPMVVNALHPWLSKQDIDVGARWQQEIGERLETISAGIICLTPSNLDAPWILFEAGALSKSLENSRVCPLLVGLEPSVLKQPLAQFQAKRADKDGIRDLLKTLNGSLGDGGLAEKQLEMAFEKWWPDLQARLDTIPNEDSAEPPTRSDHDILLELLETVRAQVRASSASTAYVARESRMISIPYSGQMTGDRDLPYVKARLNALFNHYKISAVRREIESRGSLLIIRVDVPSVGPFEIPRNQTREYYKGILETLVREVATRIRLDETS